MPNAQSINNLRSLNRDKERGKKVDNDALFSWDWILLSNMSVRISFNKCLACGYEASETYTIRLTNIDQEAYTPEYFAIRYLTVKQQKRNSDDHNQFQHNPYKTKGLISISSPPDVSGKAEPLIIPTTSDRSSFASITMYVHNNIL